MADIAVPLGLYYALRAAGVGIYLTLIIAAAVPAALAGYRLARWRRVDGLAVYVLTTMLLSTGVSLIAGSPRFLLAREGWLTAVTGLWFIGSVWVERPLTFHYGRAFLERRTARLGIPWTWDEVWDRSPPLPPDLAGRQRAVGGGSPGGLRGTGAYGLHPAHRQRSGAGYGVVRGHLGCAQSAHRHLLPPCRAVRRYVRPLRAAWGCRAPAAGRGADADGSSQVVGMP